jgi:hypothetical protein
MDGHAITALVVETKSGRQAIRARRFIDCSGDADVAHFAGVPFELGDGHGSALFPSTMFRVGHVDAGPALAAVGEFKAINDLMEQSETRQPGRYQFPRKGAILRPQKNPAEWRANVTQIRNAAGNAMDATDARQLSEGELEGRRQITEYFRFLKNEVPGFADSAIIDIAPQVGIRETRRICGAYMLTGEDILSSALFSDVIGINAWPMEMHVDGAISWGFPRDENRAYNDLPWRMLVTREVDNLLVAGRCVSATPIAQSSVRVSGPCMATGQAAGLAAALCAQSGTLPADLDVALLQRRLVEQGAFLGPQT